MRRTMQSASHSQLAQLLLTVFFTAVLLQPVRAHTSPKELLAAGHADEVIQILEQQVRHAAPDAESYNLLCRAHFMIAEWDRGMPACEHATRLGPRESF